jgi:hypothetical protein
MGVTGHNVFWWSIPWPPVQIATIRSFDSGWCFLEPTPGVWDFTTLDKDVERAQAENAQLELVLENPPGWVTGGPNGCVQPQFLLPPSIPDWITYVSIVGNRYKGKVHVYECKNEPDQPSEYGGTIAQLVPLCQAEYDTLKSIDPTITVTSPAFSGSSNAVSYAASYLQAGGIKSLDVINIHFQSEPNPEAMVSYYGGFQNLKTSEKLTNIPVWITECGYMIASGPNAKNPYTFPAGSRVLDSALSQEYVARMHLVAWALGVPKILWYAWGDDEYALVDDQGHTPKPATVAYGEVAALMSGLELLSYKVDSSGTWTLNIQDANGNPVHILWNENELTESVAVPSSWKVSQVQDLNGNTISLSGGSVSIAGLPIILKSSGN